MNVENNLLELIKTKFPRQSVRIEQLFKTDKDFRDLCTDYFSSLQALKKYRKISLEGEQSIEDYQIVLNDLEKELYDYIFP
jgi:DNA-binding protein Fis